MKSNLSMFFRTIHCFNVAAIMALAIWHGYVFYLNQAIQKTPSTPVIELKLMNPTSHPQTTSNSIQRAI